MVYTVTPNPALDLGGLVDEIRPNEKTYVHHETRHPGGNALNAARILNRLSTPVLATGFLGGATGDEIGALLDKEGLSHSFVRIQGHTRINVTVSNPHTHLQTRLSFPGPSITRAEMAQLADQIEVIETPALLLFGGSFPPGFSLPTLKRVLHSAHHRGLPFIVDAPARALKSLLATKPLLIKPNLTEFQELVGSKASSLGAVRRLAQPLLKNVALVCVSSVEGGTVMVSHTGAWHATGPRITPRSTVGAGDSMVGAMAAHLWRHRALSPQTASQPHVVEDLLRWGMGAALATLTLSGTHLGEPAAIRKFQRRIRVRQLR